MQVESLGQTWLASNCQGTDQVAEMLLLPCGYPFEFFSQHFFFTVLSRSQPPLDDFEHTRYYTSQPSPLRQIPKAEHSPKGSRRKQ